MKFFDAFAEHPFGGWVIGGLSVVAFIIVLKILVARFPDAGVPGTIKAGVNII